MIPKRFSLEAVLQVRSAAKERAEEELSVAIRSREEAVSAYARAEAALNQLSIELSVGRFTAADRQHGWNALCRQREHCVALRAALEKAEAEVSSRRTSLWIASIDHELVKRLWERWHAAQVRMDAAGIERQLEEFVNARRHLQIQPL